MQVYIESYVCFMFVSSCKRGITVRCFSIFIGGLHRCMATLETQCMELFIVNYNTGIQTVGLCKMASRPTDSKHAAGQHDCFMHSFNSTLCTDTLAQPYRIHISQVIYSLHKGALEFSKDGCGQGCPLPMDKTIYGVWVFICMTGAFWALF